MKNLYSNYKKYTFFVRNNIWVIIFCFGFSASISVNSFSQVPYYPYYGNFHSHTSYSDGSGVPEDAYTYARDTANIDFLAITDHLWLLDTNEWNLMNYYADSFTVNHTFVAIAGFEWTSSTYGHCDVFNSNDLIDVTGLFHTDLMGFYNWLSNGVNIIGQFNHPGRDPYYSNWESFQYNGSLTDSVFALIEFQNTQQAADWYEFALNKGWHLAPVWNQDNHLPDWGNKNNGRAGVWCDSLTRDQIFEAVQANRTFATMDKNALVWIGINGFDMGREVQRAYNSAFHIYLNDADGEGYSSVEIVSSVGGPVLTFGPVSGNLDTVITITPYTDNYLFVRAIQNDGDYLWSSPIYITGTITGSSNLSSENISIFPNPVNDWIHINNQDEITEVVVTDINGCIVATSNEHKMNVSDYANGIYIIKVSTAEGSYISKFIKK